MQNKFIKTCITYRLPNLTENIYLEGNAHWSSNWNDISDNVFVFHPFLGEKFLLIKDLIITQPENLIFFSKTSGKEDAPKSEYEAAFNSIMDLIESGEYSKIILSRTKRVQHNLTELQVFDSLNYNYQTTFNYVISNEEIGTWIGATPESLLSIENNDVSTMSLAGTKLANDNWTPKEYNEQVIVTKTILSDLSTYCSNIKSVGPETINAGPIQHLQTTISGQLNKSEDWSNLVKNLHPTPAVCGTPTIKAKEFIPTHESHDRKFYTGYLGLLTPQKKSFFVNLRCMEFYENSAKLYVGGGITKNSILEDEWLETERKASTLESILQHPK